MAEALLSIVVDGIINLGSQLAAKEIGLLWGVEDDLKRLTIAVSKIKAVLQDAEEKQAGGNLAVKGWLENLNDAIYDADDLLDAVSTEAIRREIMTRDKKAKRVRIFFSKSNQLFYRHKMGHKIKAMRETLDAINAAAWDFHLEVRPMETLVGNRQRDQTHSFVPVEAVIGREDDKKAVIHRLLDSNVEENISILPIVGIGGLGKTALVQLIFNDEQIKRHFELKMWVCVSDPFCVKNIVEKILEAAKNKKPKPAEMETLVGKLKKQIDGKKYLLVLDDVWNDDNEKWSNLKEVLMDGARGSRILLTTRNKSVARITETIQSYSLSGLDKDQSWSLFKHMAFKKGQEPEENSRIVELGKEILEKCSGVPLAIRTIGSLLAFKNPEEWLYFKNNELSKLSPKENGILPTLKVSYDHLPSHLKQCFAYCSLYPKDYQFRKSILVQFWVAQGFVKSSDPNRSMEDVGHEYFMDLLLRSFFQEIEMDEFGNIIQCKMHDLMHDLAKSVVGSLIATLDDNNINVDGKTRHVSFVGDCNAIISSISTSLSKASRIRTFLCLDLHHNPKIDCDAIFSSFKFLRMLDLSNKKLYFLPSSIRRLKHLRYLDLSQNYFRKLPNSITSLHNLQKLRLYGCTSLEELPRDIKQLVNLRHLDIHECNSLTYMPCGLGQLTNLQKLSRFVVHSGSHSRHSGGLKELNGLKNLRGELVILNLGYGKCAASEYEAAKLKEKQHLRVLHLKWSNEGSFNVSDVFDDERSLEGFQLHPNLKELHLFQYLGSRFPSWLQPATTLQKFQISECKNLTALPEWIQNCISLQSLEIIKCKSLASLPEGMRRLTSLQILTIRSCPIVLQRCKRHTGEDWAKIAHIPNLSLW